LRAGVAFDTGYLRKMIRERQGSVREITTKIFAEHAVFPSLFATPFRNL